MAYYNRRRQLINTLNSIEQYNGYNSGRDIEVIIVDDCSDKEERVDDLPDKFKIPIFIVPITQKFKKHSWSCPVITFNIGFNFVTGDAVIIQNPENMHVGDIVGEVIKRIKKDTYLSFACYSMSEKDTEKLHQKINSDFVFTGEAIKRAVGSFVGFVHGWKDGDTCWYNHSVYRSGYNYFCCALPRQNLEKMAGFDERYAKGIAYDDCEFLERLARLPIKRIAIDDPFVIHQFHPVTQYKKHEKKFLYNRKIFMGVTCKGKFTRAPKNKFYNPIFFNFEPKKS